ncbi:MAG TPA: hypothetical protein ENK02_07375 [Planctomycetes bacterium]|nr:hypothetical protein [Planctomycetota bacterium]
MSDWPLGFILLAFAGAILIPALVIRFTIGRNGGHHYEGLGSAMEFTRRYHQKKMAGSKFALVVLALLLLMYPLSCKLGFAIPSLDLSQGNSDLYVWGALALGGAILVRVFRNRSS